MHPRFIKGIAVRRFSARQTSQAVPATISAYPKAQNALILELDKPLDGAAAPKFDAKAAGEGTKNCSVVGMSNDDGRWQAGVQAFGGALVLAGDMKLIDAPWGLVLDKSGTAVGVSTGIDVPADEKLERQPAVLAGHLGG